VCKGERNAKRKIFDEMMEGVAAMEGLRRGKTTVRTHKVEAITLSKGSRRARRSCPKCN
jgi:hypothetical protein